MFKRADAGAVFNAACRDPGSTAAARVMGLGFLLRPVQLAELAAQGLKLAFVGAGLAFERFEQFQDFLHVVQAEAKRFDDVADVVYGSL